MAEFQVAVRVQINVLAQSCTTALLLTTPPPPSPQCSTLWSFFFIKYNIGREFDACGTWELGLGLVKNTLLLTEVTIHVGLYSVFISKRTEEQGCYELIL